MICFNSADALLLPFSSMQLSSSLMGHTGIQFNLQILGLARLCGLLSIPSVIMSNSTFSFEILYWYFDSLIGILNCTYKFIIYYFCYKRILIAYLYDRTLASGQVVQIHPSSVLFRQKPECVIFNELVQTNNKYVRNLTRVDYLWLTELAPQYYAMHN